MPKKGKRRGGDDDEDFVARAPKAAAVKQGDAAPAGGDKKGKKKKDKKDRGDRPGAPPAGDADPEAADVAETKAAKKAGKKAAKKALKEARDAERSAMLNPDSSSGPSEDEEEEMRDALGNTIPKFKRKEEAARRRAEAGGEDGAAASAGAGAGAAAGAGASAGAGSAGGSLRGIGGDTDANFGETLDEAAEKEAKKIKKLLAKREAGGKLSNKDKRALAKYDADVAEAAALKAADESGLANFSVTAAGRDAEDAAKDMENMRDVIVEKFSIGAHKKELFVDARLHIVHGRRYGLVGPNGQGKTTLLKHIAARALPIPPRVDVLYVEQEVEADDTPATLSVMKADKVHWDLWQEEQALTAELEAEYAAADAEEARLAAAGGDADTAAAGKPVAAAPPAPPGGDAGDGDDADDDGDGGAGATDGAAAPAAGADDEADPREKRLAEIYEELAALGSIEDRRAQARKILSGLGFTEEMLDRETHKFSGGWRMRISLARALYIEPTLLLLDEPTNHLDLNAVIWLDDYLQRYKNTLLIVSHDQDFLNSVVSDVIHLDQKKLTYYHGDFDTFRKMQKQTLRKQIKDWEKQEKALKEAKKAGKSSKQAEKDQRRKQRESGGAKKGRNKGAMEASDEKKDELIERPREYVVKFEFTTPPELTPPVLQVQSVDFWYKEPEPLFRGLNFGVDMDSRIVIVGPNGAGKSTLLNLMMDELTPITGEIVRNRFLRIGRYNQHFVDVLPMDKTPVEYLRSLETPDSTTITVQDARNLLGRFGLGGHAHMIKAKDLSGGQKARVVFASLTLTKPHILFFDEPTNHLDMESIDALIDGIAAFEGGVVLVTHDARLIEACDCVLWVVNDPSVVHLLERTSSDREVTDLAMLDATTADDVWRGQLRGLSTATTFHAGDPAVVEWMAGFDEYRDFLLAESRRREAEEDEAAELRRVARRKQQEERTARRKGKGKGTGKGKGGAATDGGAAAGAGDA